MEVYITSTILNIVLILVLAIVPLYQNFRNRLYIWLALLNFSIALWQMDLFLLRISPTLEFANLVSRILRNFMILIPFFMYRFIGELTYYKKEKTYKIINFILIVLVIFSIVLNIFGIGFKGCKLKGNYGFVPEKDIIYLFFLFIFIIGLGGSIFYLFKKYKDKRIISIEKKQIQYLLFATFVAVLLSSTNILNIFGLKIYPLGTFGIFIYCVLLTYASLTYNLLNIRVLLKKFFIYLFIAIGITELYYTIFIKFNEKSHFIIFLITIFILISIRKLLNFFDEIIQKIFFSKELDYQTILNTITEKIKTIKNIEKLFTSVIKDIKQILKIKDNIIFFESEEENKFLSYEEAGKTDKIIELNHPLVKYMEKKRNIIFYKEILDKLNHYISLKENKEDIIKIKKLFEAYKCEICFPIIIGDIVKGILFIGEKEKKYIFRNEEIVFLKNIVQQITFLIENILLQEKLIKSERLAISGKMAAAVAHEIRNPLSGLSAFLQMIKENKNNQNLIDRFLTLSEKEFIRLEKLTNNLLTLGHATRLKLELTNINELIDEVNDFIFYSYKKNKISIMKYFKDVPEIYIDREQIKEALLNVILNAIQAMPKGGKIEFYTDVVKKDDKKYIKIDIKDNGVGIEKDILPKIFDPFFTTKRVGSGIGLAITKKIIEVHNGFITVESEKGKGSIFSLFFSLE